MILTEKRETYCAFGLRIESGIRFPELTIDEEVECSAADVEIVIGDLSKTWFDLGFHESDYAGNEREVFFHIKDVAVFCVQEGKRIIVSPAAGSSEDQIRLYLLGTCMGTVLMQRKMLPLHGSAVMIDGKAYAIVGESGAGKSTLAAAFLGMGYRLVSDDVIAVSFSSKAGFPIVTPSYPQQKLWQESLVHMERGSHGYTPLYQETTKFAVPVKAQFCADSLPLAGVIELVKADRAAEIRQINGLQRLSLLLNHTYRQFLLPVLKLQSWHFGMITALSGQICVYRVERSTEGFTAYDIANQILHKTQEAVYK